MKRVLLVRHGDIAADMGRYWGHTDVALSGDGRRQADRLRERLAAEDIGAAYSSDLRRAADTAAIIAGRHHVPVVPCPALREILFGRCEGLTYDEVIARFPALRGIWTGGDLEACFPGGESVGALADRLGSFMGTLRENQAGTVLVVAHGGPLRLLVCSLTGLDVSAWGEMRIDRASLSVVEWDGGAGRALLLNDLSHLSPENVRSTPDG